MSAPSNAENARQVEADEAAALAHVEQAIADEATQVRNDLAAARAEIARLAAILVSFGIDPATGQPALPAVRSVDFGSDVDSNRP